MPSYAKKFNLRDKALPEVWEIAKQELAQAGCPWRLRLIRTYPWIRVRHFVKGEIVDDFKIDGLVWYDPQHIRQARDLCLAAQSLGEWPLDDAQASPDLSQLTWPSLCARTHTFLRGYYLKQGSRQGYEQDLRLRIAKLPEPVTAEALKDWVLEATLPAREPQFKRRELLLVNIDKAIQELDLKKTVQDLRDYRKAKCGGAQAKQHQVKADKVRVLPEDQAIQDWLDGLDKEYAGLPFYRLLFAYCATYGLRPHELWHMEGMTKEGWLIIPGGPKPDADGRCWKTKSKATHECPPIPHAWLDRYKLRENLEPFQQALRDRWAVKWAPIYKENNAGEMVNTGFTMPANNNQLGQYPAKLFQQRPPGLKQAKPGPPPVTALVAPLAEGEGFESVVPYDFRHCYAIRAAVHPETINFPLYKQAEWMGHSEDVHRDHYLKWITRRRQEAGIDAEIKQWGNYDQQQDTGASEREQALEAKIEKLQRALNAALS